MRWKVDWPPERGEDMAGTMPSLQNRFELVEVARMSEMFY